MTTEKESRINEWFVPKFGPVWFRVIIGLLFLPYTGMCVSFAIIGSLISPSLSWERLGAIALIYALALGVSAHAVDTIGSKKAKPWGNYFTRKQMLILTGVALAISYAVGVYYIVFFVPLLAPIAVMEGFFLFAYNFELFGGRFHNDFWFVVSWGVLPTLAGYVIQTNSFDLLPLGVSIATGLASLLEIRLSRPYKGLKRMGTNSIITRRLERGLKVLSTGTISVAIVFVVLRIIFS